ncbi:membrane hypothetical protein [Candidatus Magnetomoraceae bacterium gMMP-15]
MMSEEDREKRIKNRQFFNKKLSDVMAELIGRRTYLSLPEISQRNFGQWFYSKPEKPVFFFNQTLWEDRITSEFDDRYQFITLKGEYGQKEAKVCKYYRSLENKDRYIILMNHACLEGITEKKTLPIYNNRKWSFWNETMKNTPLKYFLELDTKDIRKTSEKLLSKIQNTLKSNGIEVKKTLTWEQTASKLSINFFNGVSTVFNCFLGLVIVLGGFVFFGLTKEFIEKTMKNYNNIIISGWKNRWIVWLVHICFIITVCFVFLLLSGLAHSLFSWFLFCGTKDEALYPISNYLWWWWGVVVTLLSYSFALIWEIIENKNII